MDKLLTKKECTEINDAMPPEAKYGDVFLAIRQAQYDKDNAPDSLIRADERKKIGEWLRGLLEENTSKPVARYPNGQKTYYIQNASDWLCINRIKDILESNEEIK